MRARAEADLDAVNREAAAYKQKLQEAATEQGQAARLATDLDLERKLHQEAKSHAAALDSRFVTLSTSTITASYMLLHAFASQLMCWTGCYWHLNHGHTLVECMP